MGAIRRKASCFGVTVTVIARKENFDVMVSLEPGEKICRIRSTKKEPTYFNLKFKNMNPKMKIVIGERTYGVLKQQNYNSQNPMSNCRRDIPLSNGMVCTVSLRPELYLSEDLMEKYKKKKAQKDAKKREERERKRLANMAYQMCKEARRGPSNKINCKGPIMYSKTNITRPYQGGRCSPK